MRPDSRYEISRALDELPHVVGASCATASFRAAGERSPARDEYRRRAASYFGEFAAQIARDGALAGLRGYVERRIASESERILTGQNPEIERRYDRYVDYG